LSDLWISIANGSRRAQIEAKVLALEGRFLNPERSARTKGTSDGRVFPMTADLRAVLKPQHAEHERLEKAGCIFPNVFWRMVADERGGAKHPKAITSFNKVWKLACRAVGCPGRIPHDLRRTAVRNFVRSGTSENVAMKLSGHKTRSVFDRYDIGSGADLREAARKLNVAAGR
jgi:integrase